MKTLTNHGGLIVCVALALGAVASFVRGDWILGIALCGTISGLDIYGVDE
jgi:hypothetical protein